MPLPKPAVMPDDHERAVVDILTTLMADESNLDIRIGGPEATWRPGDTPVIVVDSFTAAAAAWPVLTRPTIRLVAYSNSTTESKRLARKAYGLLCAYEGAISPVKPLTGPDAARDDATHAELCSVELQIAMRSVPIE